MIAQEYGRQMREQGWSAAHNDELRDAELSRAGAAYATTAAIQIRIGGTGRDFRFGVGDFPCQWFKAGGWQPSDDPERNLAVAGAYIARELDRLRRQKTKRAVPPEVGPGRILARRIATERLSEHEASVEQEGLEKGSR